MKKSFNLNLKRFFFLPLIVLMTFSSCQDEITEVTEPNEQETVLANSTLANLMQSTATRDGSFDNIIDNANCISINLPVTITVNGITITIETIEGYEALEAILDQFNNDPDEIEIQFPITITLSDFQQILINDYDELNNFVEECFGENEEDEDIECIDFKYPFSISVYDANFQLTDTVTINSDEDLYTFIDNLEAGVLASINFPINMVLANGEIITVNNNEELQTAIEEAEDDCDEDDDNDFNDDDDCDEESIELALKACAWNISVYEQSDVFSNYYIDFEPDYNFVVFIDGDLKYGGVWSVSESANDGYELTLSTNWEDLNGTWEVVNCQAGAYQLLKANSETDMTITKDCDVELDNAFLCYNILNLESCDYDGDDLAEFNLYGAFGETCVSTVQRSVGFYPTLSDAENQTNGVPNATSFTTSSQTAYIRVTILNTQDVHRIYPTELTVQDCTTPCSEEDLNIYLEGCIWNVVNVDGNENLITYNFDFNANEELIITNTITNEVNNANWSVFPDPTTGRLILGFSNIGNSDLNDIYGNWDLYECAEDRLKFEKFDGTFMVLESDCENNDPCTETDVDAYVLECIWNTVSLNGSDDLIIFDMDFNQDGTLTITGDGQTIYANWATSEISDGVVVEFSNVNGGNIQAINGAWLITECAEDRFKMFNDNEDYIILERDCN